MLINALSVTCCRFKGERGKEKGSCAESVRDYTWEVLFVILVIIILFRHSIPEQRSNGEDPSSKPCFCLILVGGTCSLKLAYALGLLEVPIMRLQEYKLRWALVGTTTCCIVCASQYGHTYRMLVLSSGRYAPCRNMYP